MNCESHICVSECENTYNCIYWEKLISAVLADVGTRGRGLFNVWSANNVQENGHGYNMPD